jgi:hypothetical protein
LFSPARYDKRNLELHFTMRVAQMDYEAGAGAPRPEASDADDESGNLDRRKFERTKVALPARYLAPEGGEHDCETVDVSPNGVRFKAPQRPFIGDHVIAYVRDLGRVQGVAVRLLADGFAIAVGGTWRKTERLVQKIAWLQRKESDDRRLFQRLELEGAEIALRCADGREQVVQIIDISSTGIAFHSDLKLDVGERVEIGRQQAVIARLFAGGAAASFS